MTINVSSTKRILVTHDVGLYDALAPYFEQHGSPLVAAQAACGSGPDKLLAGDQAVILVTAGSPLIGLIGQVDAGLDARLVEIAARVKAVEAALAQQLIADNPAPTSVIQPQLVPPPPEPDHAISIITGSAKAPDPAAAFVFGVAKAPYLRHLQTGAIMDFAMRFSDDGPVTTPIPAMATSGVPTTFTDFEYLPRERLIVSAPVNDVQLCIPVHLGVAEQLVENGHVKNATADGWMTLDDTGSVVARFAHVDEVPEGERGPPKGPGPLGAAKIREMFAAAEARRIAEGRPDPREAPPPADDEGGQD